MSAHRSTSKRIAKTRKPKYAKPYDGFPLTPHPTGRWCKRVANKLHYLGKIADDPDGTAALERFNREYPYLKDGRTPPPVDVGDGCTIKLLCNAFLSSKKNKLDSGELSHRSFLDYQKTTDRLIEFFGKDRRIDDLRPEDFAKLRARLANGKSPKTLMGRVSGVRIVMKFAYDERLIDSPVLYGQSFDRPSAKSLRKARNESGLRLFEADEVRRILDSADIQSQAMTLLGVNCGFGNTDVATLPQSAIDFDGGWIQFSRPKTEIARRVPLWPETVDALRKAIVKRPSPKDKADAGLVFLTTHGTRWVRVQSGKDDPDKATVIDALSQRFARLLKTLGINGRRGLGFDTLRHVFETVAGESKDQVAVNAIMGHVDNSMAAVYRERISDERLQAVVETVRR